MPEPTPAEILTTWAAPSDRRAVHFLRTTLGPLLLILATPPAGILFWIVCTFAPFNGSLLPLLRGEGWQAVAAHWPAPSLRAAAIVLGFMAFQALLLIALPGKEYLGPLTPSGARPRYKLNGIAAWVITHVLALAGFSRLGIVWDLFGEILATLVTLALVFCAYLYLQGRFWPSSPDRSLSGNFIWDFYWGVELHPLVLKVNLKQLVNCRFSMMGWSVLACCFAAKQASLSADGVVSNAMLVSTALMVIYLLRFFVWESGYFTSLDVMHDRFGFYICGGVLTWVPAVYPLPAQYLVLRPVVLHWPLAVLIFLFGGAAIFINYLADAQRQRVRATNGATIVWGRPPALIHARYITADGLEHANLLLASGWWGLARHFHYVPEILLALAWSLPAGFTHFLPYFYVVYLTILLLDRANRDDKRCRRKYGAAWEEYCRRVPWKVIPRLY